jgi:hypothetical protein
MKKIFLLIFCIGLVVPADSGVSIYHGVEKSGEYFIKKIDESLFFQTRKKFSEEEGKQFDMSGWIAKRTLEKIYSDYAENIENYFNATDAIGDCHFLALCLRFIIDRNRNIKQYLIDNKIPIIAIGGPGQALKSKIFGFDGNLWSMYESDTARCTEKEWIDKTQYGFSSNLESKGFFLI